MADSARASSAAPSRKAFALTGRSVVLDPLTNAVRGDLADVRLAEFVFAPHYAAPLPCLATQETVVFGDRARSNEVVTIAGGDAFEVLELAGDNAWGIASARQLVGYVDRAALEIAAKS